MSVGPPIRLRPQLPEDESFIFNSWLRSYHKRAYGAPNNVYFLGQHEVIKRRLEKSLVTLAVDPEDGDHIYGYIVYELRDGVTAAHWLYVKFPFRRMGIATMLLRDMINKAIGVEIVYTTQTFAGEQVAKKYEMKLCEKWS